MSRVVITGGAGFLGSHLCERFLGCGDAVVCVDNLSTGQRSNVAHLEDDPRFSLRVADTAQPLDVEGDVSGVLNFASPASPVDYGRLPLETLGVGTFGTYHALELARGKGARFLQASTSEVYGDPLQHPQREDYWGNVNAIGPRSIYDEGKRVGETYTMAYHRTFDLDTRIVRIFNTYGPRMRMDDGRAIPSFLTQALAGEPLTVFGDGTQTRSLCYVDDLVEGIMRLWECEHVLPVNIGTTDELTMLDLARLVIEVTGSTSSIEHRPLPTDDPLRRRPDLATARSILGWAPGISLRDGIEMTAAWWRSAS